jgi:plasmid stabilization system protein ParE
MPKYTVVWRRSAISELAEIRVEAANRNAIAQATRIIDRELGTNPKSAGRELSEGLRVLVEPPLRILYVCKDDDRVVEVVRIKLL